MNLPRAQNGRLCILVGLIAALGAAGLYEAIELRPELLDVGVARPVGFVLAVFASFALLAGMALIVDGEVV